MHLRSHATRYESNSNHSVLDGLPIQLTNEQNVSQKPPGNLVAEKDRARPALSPSAGLAVVSPMLNMLQRKKKSPTRSARIRRAREL